MPPAVQDDGLLLPAAQTNDAFVFTAIAMAESGGNSNLMPHTARTAWVFFRSTLSLTNTTRTPLQMTFTIQPDQQ